MSKKKSRNFVPSATQIAVLRTLRRGGYLEQDEHAGFRLYNDTDESIPVRGYRGADVHNLHMKSMISSINKNYVIEIEGTTIEFVVYKITSKGIALLAQIDAEEERMWEL